MECPLNQEERELYEKLKGFEVPNQVYYHYINNVRGRSLCSREEAKKRLIKNSIIGYRRCKDNNRIQVSYGCLYIVINLNEKKFAYIENDVEHPKKLYRDRVKEQWIKEDLGLVKKLDIPISMHYGIIENEKCQEVIKDSSVRGFFKKILVGWN